MGIPGARQVYENTYGTENGRVIVTYETNKDEIDEHAGGVYNSLFKKPAPASPSADFSLDLIDFPTFNFTELSIIGKNVAAAALENRNNMGQMILFFDKSNGRIVDSLHDKFNVITKDDIDCRDRNRQIIRSHAHVGSEARGLATLFFSKVRNMDKRAIGIKRVQVRIPTNQEEVDRLLDPPIAELMMTPPAKDSMMTDFEGINQWLNKHGGVLKPRQILTNRFLVENITGLGNSAPSSQKRFTHAFYASELEGLILMYAHRMVNTIKNLLVNSNKTSKGRYTVLFMDCAAPAIKRCSRMKRKNCRKSMELKKKKKLADAMIMDKENTAAASPYNKRDAASEMLFLSCERLMIRLPQGVMTAALMDAMRVPLVKTTCTSNLYLVLSNYSEAEDDMVRLASCFLGLETPIKHFCLLDKKGLIQYDTNNTSKVFALWKSLFRPIRTLSLQGQSIAVNVFSHDSDVLATWNLMVAHHKSVCKVLGIDYSSREPNVKLGGLKFVRRVDMGGGGRTTTTSTLGGMASENRSRINTIYDLTQSPLMLSPESTMLIMLTKGSDYNTPLASEAKNDTQIRTEATMFERLSCTCVYGWEVFFEEIKQSSVAEVDCGNLSQSNMSTRCCGSCGKRLVLPFWSSKFFFLSQAVAFVSDPKHLCFPPKDLAHAKKHDLHRSLAANVAANVMVYLSMGSFNQHIFGNINSMGKIADYLFETENTKPLDDVVAANAAVAASSTPAAAAPEAVVGGVGGDFERALAGFINKRKVHEEETTGDGAVKKKRNKHVLVKKTTPVKRPLTLAVYDAKRRFFHYVTEGGIPTSKEQFEDEKKSVFGKVFECERQQHEQLPELPRPFQTSSSLLTEKERQECNFLASFLNTREKKSSSGVSAAAINIKVEKAEEDSFFDDDDDDWFNRAKRIFDDKDTFMIKEEGGGSSTFDNEIKPMSVDQDTPQVAAATAASTDNNYKIMPWAELCPEFDKCLSIKNIEFTDSSILSKMTSLLVNKGTVLGIDDDRPFGVPYTIKAMNLLMIVYMNMCGLEDNRIVSSQLLPIIHQERMEVSQNSCSNSVVASHTDRTNFMSAALEYTMLQYMPELKSSSTIKQCKRKNWEKIADRLTALRRCTSVCYSNSQDLLEALGVQHQHHQQPGKTTWIPKRGSFMPFIGLTTPKPWSLLSLWSAFVYYTQSTQAE